MPLMVFISPETATGCEPVINCSLAALDVALLWWLAARIGVERIRDRVWLAILLALGTDLWWVVVRGGVWHTGHLVATMLTLMALIECFGRRRPLLIGLLAGAAFLTRPPVAFAVALLRLHADARPKRQDGRRPPGDRPRLVRPGPGHPALDRLLLLVQPDPVRIADAIGLRPGAAAACGWPICAPRASSRCPHLGRNWDYFMLRLPQQIDVFPVLPAGLARQLDFFTSPALLLGLWAGWRRSVSWALALTFAAIMLPNLLYYGGGWYQFGFRYALDAIPFLLVLCALALRRRSASLFWWGVLAFCVCVNAGGIWWCYQGF